MNNKAEYTPEKVVDISNLSREDWLEYRKKGIGGSDVAAIMGISPFATIRDLFYNKTGVQPVIQEEEESNWVAKEVGHRLEDLVAEIFSKKTGLEVFPVRVMFRHPLYPFMLADTGVTRAKSKVYLVGEWAAVCQAIHTDDSGTRNTILSERIVQYYDQYQSEQKPEMEQLKLVV